jgi:RNA polymerase sigma-70 factor (ECF subfamily)
LTAWEGLAPREIARVLGLPAAVVSVRLHRARRRFAAALAPRAPDLVPHGEHS